MSFNQKAHSCKIFITSDIIFIECSIKPLRQGAILNHT